MHVHFFFNTVPVEQAGSPGSGPGLTHISPFCLTSQCRDEYAIHTQAYLELLAVRLCVPVTHWQSWQG
jgi:hypothetical protein